MTTAASTEVEAYCEHRGYAFDAEWINPPFSGVLFRARADVRFSDIVDARADGAPPFILGRVAARGRLRREIAVIVMPLRRPVPNMILRGKRGSVFPGLGIALAEDQLLKLEGDFNSRFSLYCPQRYEHDALYVFTPDVMAQLIDIAGISDVEFVDDRVLLYAPLEALYAGDRLDTARQVAGFVAERLDRSTRLYRDERGGAVTDRDPFRKAQLTTGGDEQRLVGVSGRRSRTRTTAWQKVGIGITIAAALAAGTYWVSMIIRSFSMHG